MKMLFPTTKDFISACISGAAVALVYAGNALAGGLPLDWKAFAVGVAGVFVNAVLQRLKPLVAKMKAKA